MAIDANKNKEKYNLLSIYFDMFLKHLK